MEIQDQILTLQILAAIAAFIAMVTDMKWGRIYNWLTFPAIFIGWGLNFFFFGLPGLGYSFAATIIGITIYVLPAAFGLIGMGDVKLLGAIGALGGTKFVVSVFLYTSAFGIPHALLIQTLNYGKNALSMLITSLSTGAFFSKTIQKENENLKENKKFRFFLGIDIFLATLSAIIYVINLKI